MNANRLSRLPVVSWIPRSAWIVLALANAILLIVFLELLHPVLIGLDLSERWQVVRGWSGRLHRGELVAEHAEFFAFRTPESESFELRRLGVRVMCEERCKFDLAVRDDGARRIVFRASRSALYPPGVYLEENGGSDRIAAVRFTPEAGRWHDVELARENGRFLLVADGAPATIPVEAPWDDGRFGLSGVRGGLRVDEAKVDAVAGGRRVQVRESIGWTPAALLIRIAQFLVFFNGAVFLVILLFRLHRARLNRLLRHFEGEVAAGRTLHLVAPGALVAVTAVVFGVLFGRAGAAPGPFLAALIPPAVWVVYGLLLARIARLPWRLVFAADAYTFVPVIGWGVVCAVREGTGGEGAIWFVDHLWKAIPFVVAGKVYIALGYVRHVGVRAAAPVFALLAGIVLGEAATWAVPADRFAEEVATMRTLNQRAVVRFDLDAALNHAVGAGERPGPAVAGDAKTVVLAGINPTADEEFTSALARSLDRRGRSGEFRIEPAFPRVPERRLVTSLDVLHQLPEDSGPGGGSVLAFFGPGDAAPSPVYPLTLAEYLAYARDRVERADRRKGPRFYLAARDRLLRARLFVSRIMKRYRHVPQVSETEFRANVERILAEAAQGGRRAVLVLPPLLPEYLAYEGRPGQPEHPYYRLLERTGADLGAQVIDSNLALYRQRGVALFTDPVTLNEEGARILADALADALIELETGDGADASL